MDFDLNPLSALSNRERDGFQVQPTDVAYVAYVAGDVMSQPEDRRADRLRMHGRALRWAIPRVIIGMVILGFLIAGIGNLVSTGTLTGRLDAAHRAEVCQAAAPHNRPFIAECS